MATAQETVASSIGDDDCESFFVVKRFGEDEEPESVSVIVQGEDEEQFSDPTGEILSHEDGEKSSLGSTIIEGESVMDDKQQQRVSSMMVSSAEGHLMTMEDERFSMTNYSTASSSSEQQLEELQGKLTQVVNDHKSLKELIERQNLELEHRKMAIDELKLLANESVAREKAKSEESRKIVQKVTEERDSVISQLESIKLGQQPAGYENGESLESQLKNRDQIIQLNGEQIKQLSNALHQEILRRGELEKFIQVKSEEDKHTAESLSSSDEALAKTILEKERLEELLKADIELKNNFQQQVLNLKEQLGAAQNEINRLQDFAEKLDNKCGALDSENQEMRIKLAALEAEKERQNDLYTQEISKNENLTQEKLTLKHDFGRVTEMLHAKTVELENLQGQKQMLGGSSNGGNFIDLFRKKEARNSSGPKSYGIRDVDDDPNEPFQDPKDPFEHVSAQAARQDSTPEIVCPLCNKKFSSIRPLEIHASSCGEGMVASSDPFVFP